MYPKGVIAVRRFAVSGLVAVAFLALIAAPAAARATSQTFHFHNETDSFPTDNPCSGVPGTVTVTFNGVVHMTTLDSGAVHGTETMTGTFSFVPDDPSQPSYTGRFTSWDGFNANSQNFTATATFRVRGTGSDGSTLTFHDNAHFSVSATGVTISFDRPRCG
jgi:hypothetical protein